MKGENGGAKVFTLELIINMARLAKDIKFILFTSPNAHSEIKSLVKMFPNIKCQLAPQYRIGFLLRLFCRLLGKNTFMYKKKLDLLFCPFTAPNVATSKVPTICLIYDLQYKTYPEFFSPAECAQRDANFLAAVKKADFLVTISEYTRKTVLEHARVDENKVKTIYIQGNRLANYFNKSEEEELILAKYTLIKGQYLFYPANYWQHKNHGRLFAAFALAFQKGLGKHIKLICTGSLKVNFNEDLKKLNLKQNVILAGYVSEYDLSIILKNSLALVFPSLYEGFGIPVIEAMRSKIPVACSNVTALPEVVGQAAMLFNPHDIDSIAASIVNISQDNKERQRLIKEGVLQSAKFSNPSKMAAEYLEIFRQVC
ncbi:MAG: hypothetical protein A3F18_06110 [Legionellales bacterium RIFCSPHIGHO2_12_FULL_37_14]|nr:MAG: hypothetical protein A3F18_06110 [Legionellales bacterium RIFCSPHIGHO2_12_FULL_37_14]